MAKEGSAEAASKEVICFAQITHQMGRIEGDFENGAVQGSHAALEIIELSGPRWSLLR
jgi:uridine phosphorylase